ncbi:MAG: amidohydrolase family protein [Gammaproteobacteria bacterium]|nr:amidohydrolase family protein [Gammaproteobacteria bacterium]
MAIGDGRILALGSSRDIEAAFRGEVRDLDGAMVLPGFHDAHSHPIAGGIQGLQCDLSGAASVAETLERIEACHREMPPGESAGDDWLVGGGWNLGLFPDGNPHKRLLDGIVGDRPVYLAGEDGHSGWVNSAALERANITADTEDPPQGVIERDPRWRTDRHPGAARLARRLVGVPSCRKSPRRSVRPGRRPLSRCADSYRYRFHRGRFGGRPGLVDLADAWKVTDG